MKNNISARYNNYLHMETHRAVEIAFMWNSWEYRCF